MIAARISELVVRLIFRVAAPGVFRIRIVGRENIPARGPALLVANHVSFADAFLIGFCVRPVVRFLVWGPYYHSKLLNGGLRLARAIPVGTRVRDLVESIRRARQELQRGEVLCVFAEGSITRTGELLPFKRGLEKIARGSAVPIIPVHLDGLWGSVFSFAGGGFFHARPRWRRPVTISFGAPMPASSAAYEVRQAVERLAAEAAALRDGEKRPAYA